MAILKDLILSRVVSEMQSLREHQQEEQLQQQHHQSQQQQQEEKHQQDHQEHQLLDSEETLSGLSKKKRFFLPLTGRAEDLPAMKRQIRYHQCYFNPISCFRRK
ncbi:UNVERIFIED_CONTAM: hypothetical protein RMT77_014384 [Armadillidium vulgare]